MRRLKGLILRILKVLPRGCVPTGRKVIDPWSQSSTPSGSSEIAAFPALIMGFDCKNHAFSQRHPRARFAIVEYLADLREIFFLSRDHRIPLPRKSWLARRVVVWRNLYRPDVRQV